MPMARCMHFKFKAFTIFLCSVRDLCLRIVVPFSRVSAGTPYNLGIATLGKYISISKRKPDPFHEWSDIYQFVTRSALKSALVLNNHSDNQRGGKSWLGRWPPTHFRMELNEPRGRQLKPGNYLTNERGGLEARKSRENPKHNAPPISVLSGARRLHPQCKHRTARPLAIS